MTSAFDSSFDYTNLQGLGSLRAAADTPEAKRAVAQQLEGMFLGLMIKEMRDASHVEGGLFDSDQLVYVWDSILSYPNNL